MCAQALYAAQSLTTRDPALKAQFGHAAREETDHLAWTQTRLDDSPDDKAETIGQPLPNVEVKVIGSNFETFVNGVSVKTVTDATTPGPAYLNSHVHGVGVVLGTDYVLVDDVRVRKIVTTEPTHGAWGTQDLNPARRKMLYY